MEQVVAVILLAAMLLGFLALTEWGPRSDDEGHGDRSRKHRPSMPSDRK